MMAVVFVHPAIQVNTVSPANVSLWSVTMEESARMASVHANRDSWVIITCLTICCYCIYHFIIQMGVLNSNECDVHGIFDITDM